MDDQRAAAVARKRRSRERATSTARRHQKIKKVAGWIGKGTGIAIVCLVFTLDIRSPLIPASAEASAGNGPLPFDQMFRASIDTRADVQAVGAGMDRSLDLLETLQREVAKLGGQIGTLQKRVVREERSDAPNPGTPAPVAIVASTAPAIMDQGSELPPDFYFVEPGSCMRSTLLNWTRKAGWTLKWDVPGVEDVCGLTPERFEGAEFTEVITRFKQSLRLAQQLEFEMWPDGLPPKLLVTGTGEDKGGLVRQQGGSAQ